MSSFVSYSISIIYHRQYRIKPIITQFYNGSLYFFSSAFPLPCLTFALMSLTLRLRYSACVLPYSMPREDMSLVADQAAVAAATAASHVWLRALRKGSRFFLERLNSIRDEAQNIPRRHRLVFDETIGTKLTLMHLVPPASTGACRLPCRSKT